MGAGDFGERLARLIATFGPIPLAQYMAESNAHYYAGRDPLGAAGDFVTAPEISQMFGEMIGAWLADMAIRAQAAVAQGQDRLALVELGPGRGTLARDALRVMTQAVPAIDLHLVEGSPVLRAAQSEHLSAHAPRFHDDVTTLPTDRPLLVIANEFFDALPIRQLVRTADGWREIMVACRDGRFVPVPAESAMDMAVPEPERHASEGTIVETCPAASAIMRDIARRIADQGGAMLVFDYGYRERGGGSSFQAVRAHETIDPFSAPGEADLTAHVDFAALGQAAQAGGCRVDGIAGQGAFLRALGIADRCEALVRANPAEAATLRDALDRLVSPARMGTLFKAMALAAPGWPPSAGFAIAE